MNLASDERLKELNRLTQVETDPQKLLALTAEFTRRLQELQDIDKSSKLPGTGNAA
jgi:hypothetical protein